MQEAPFCSSGYTISDRITLQTSQGSGFVFMAGLGKRSRLVSLMSVLSFTLKQSTRSPCAHWNLGWGCGFADSALIDSSLYSPVLFQLHYPSEKSQQRYSGLKLIAAKSTDIPLMFAVYEVNMPFLTQFSLQSSEVCVITEMSNLKASKRLL